MVAKCLLSAVDNVVGGGKSVHYSKSTEQIIFLNYYLVDVDAVLAVQQFSYPIDVMFMLL